MTYVLWAFPALVIVGAIGSGRMTTTQAAILGLLSAIPIAIGAGPTSFGSEELGRSIARGIWIGSVIAPYILGGLLFWKVAAQSTDASTADSSFSVDDGLPVDKVMMLQYQRRIVFMACFLVGPFAESATGFGVGMLGTVILIRRFNFAPRYLMVFALLSQTVIPWGAMSSGTLLAATYAKIPAAQLGLYTVIPVALLMLVWLALYWRTVNLVGLSAPRLECFREVGWIFSSLSLLAVSTSFLGPETALLAAYGPLIVLRYLTDFRPNHASALIALRRAAPYIFLICALTLSRLFPELKNILTTLFRVALFEDLPSWSPLFHAGTWLIVGGIATAVLRNQGRVLGREAKAAWVTGKHAVLTVFLFAIMAEVLSASGISVAIARGLFITLHERAVLLTPTQSIAGTL